MRGGKLTGLAAAEEAAGDGGPRTARPEHDLLPPTRHQRCGRSGSFAVAVPSASAWAWSWVAWLLRSGRSSLLCAHDAGRGRLLSPCGGGGLERWLPLFPPLLLLRLRVNYVHAGFLGTRGCRLCGRSDLRGRD